MNTPVSPTPKPKPTPKKGKKTNQTAKKYVKRAFYAQVSSKAKEQLDNRLATYGLRGTWIIEGLSLLNDDEFQTLMTMLRHSHERATKTT